MKQHTNLWQLLLKQLDLQPQKKKPHPQLISPSESLEQMANMVSLPFHLENFMTFGLLACLNSFLRLVILLPLKIFVDCLVLVWAIRGLFIIRPQKSSLLKIVNVGNLVFTSLVSLAILFSNVDTSKIYHTIRAQSSIKLYVMFGVLEISDKLLSTVGQDLLNYLFSQAPAEVIKSPSAVVRYLIFYAASFVYLSLHTIVLVYQTISLNVAANSYSNSLVTLLLSNQFAEIKGSVFKRLDREGLFQMSCADIVERFQLLIQLGIIALRNMVEIGNDPQNSGLLPNATIHGVNKWFGVVLGPTAVVIGSELLVDWVKHSYITKFNKIKPKIYNKYLEIISQDVIDNFKIHVSSDSPDKIQQRLGIPLPALFVLFAVMSKEFFIWFFYEDGEVIVANVLIGVIIYTTLIVVKLLLELALLKWSNDTLKQHSKDQHITDYVSGVVSGGQGAMDEETRVRMHEKPVESFESIRAKKDSKSNLSGVTRYRMASKRIW
jgi:hypothetical protein